MEPIVEHVFLPSHDEWCAMDEGDDAAVCICHLSVIAAQKARIEELEAENAGRSLMDAEGDAFLPEVVRQLRERIEELETLVRQYDAQAEKHIAAITAGKEK